MKKIIVTFAVVVMATISIAAQERSESRRSPEERTEKIIAKMKTDLALSDDQVGKLKPVILKREHQLDELRTKMADARDRQKQITREAATEFKNILTPEQQEKLKKQRREMHEKRVNKSGKLNHEIKEKE